MKTSVSAICLALTLLTQPAKASDKTLVQIVVDHSGVMLDERDLMGRSTFRTFAQNFLEEFARRHRRDRDDTVIRIISASARPYVLWSGTASELYREGLQDPALQAIFSDAPSGCNNLPTALDEAVVGAEIYGHDAKTILHVISSGVHSGPDCHDLSQDDYDALVENADPDLIEALAEVAPQFDTFTLQFMSAAQRRDILAGLREAGVRVGLFAQGEEARF